jgi:hypothetical protein
MILGSKMRLATKIGVHLLYAVGLIVFVTLSGNKFSWMQELDSSIRPSPIDDAIGSRAIFTFLLLATIVATQLGLILMAVNKSEKLVSLVLSLVAISVWLATS